MNKFLSSEANKYLIESLSKRITKNISLELSEELGKSKNLFEAKKDTNGPTPTTSFGGGFGTGVGEKETDTSKSFRNVLFGSKSKGLMGTSPEASALGLYGAGKAAGFGADILDAFGAQKLGGWLTKKGIGSTPVGFLGKALQSKAISAIPGLGADILRQFETLSGASRFDANVGRIGPSEMELTAQGAGSPWTPFAIPGKTKAERKGYDPNVEQDEALKAAERAQRIAKARSQGYNIP
jgi:hypothetical protein